MTPWRLLVNIHAHATRFVLGRRLVAKNATCTAESRERLDRLRKMADDLDVQTIEIARESGILVGAGVCTPDPDLHVARTYEIVDQANEALRKTRGEDLGAMPPVDTGPDRTPFPPRPEE